MDNKKVLEMINNFQIEELRALLTDEIYKDSLEGNGDAKKRYTAMKRYFKYSIKNDLRLALPCKDIKLLDSLYNCFIDNYTLACTTESIGELESHDNSRDTYFDVNSLLVYPHEYKMIDLNSILAEAKSKGYKYKRSETGGSQSFQFCFKYKDGYFKIGLLDQSYSIINDGDKAEVYYNGAKSLLIIKTSIGICGILPMDPRNMENRNSKTIINVETETHT